MTDWLFTKGGQEFVGILRQLMHSMASLVSLLKEKSESVATVEQVRERDISIVAEDIFTKLVVDECVGFESGMKLNEDQVRHYARQSLKAARIFVEERDGLRDG